MKTVLALIVAALAAGLGTAASGCAAGKAPEDDHVSAARMDDTRIQGREAVLTVYGMSCPLCASNVDKSLLAVRGVTNVDVDMSTGTARIGLDGKTPVTRRQLAEAVDRSGFTLKRIEAH